MDEGRKDSVFLGQENPIHQNKVIWMEGACSLNLAKKTSMAKCSSPKPLRTHHLQHKVAITLEAGSLLGKDVGNKIQESLSVLLRMHSRNLCPRLWEERKHQQFNRAVPPPSPHHHHPQPPHCSDPRNSLSREIVKPRKERLWGTLTPCLTVLAA